MPTKTIFQLVRKALDQLKADVVEVHGPQADAAIAKALPALREYYNHLTDPNRPAIDYAPAEIRFAYVLCYVGAHADFVYQILLETSDLLGNEIAARENVVVTALGGGPGSDLVGLMQYLVEHESSGLDSVTCYLIDKEQAWADCWTEIGREVPSDFYLSTIFQGLDVTKPDNWAKQRKFLSADLFLLIYFASEVSRLGNAAKQFWTDLSSRAKPGALMLVIDNDDSRFKTFITTNLIGDRWEVLKVKAARYTPSYDEQVSDLGDHLKLYGAHPRTVGKLVYWVLRRKA